MKMRDKEAALASREWKHWSKYWHIYLIVFGLAALFFISVTDTEIFIITIIGIIAGISVFLRELSIIHGRQIYSFIAALGVMLPIIVLAPRIKDSGNIWDLLLWVSIVGATIALLHGVISKYMHPNNKIQGMLSVSRHRP